MTATACVFVLTPIDLPSLFDGVAEILTSRDPSAPPPEARRVYVRDGGIGYEPGQGLPALAWVTDGRPSDTVPDHFARAYFDAPLAGGHRYVGKMALDLCRWLTARGHKCGWRTDFDYRYHDYSLAAARAAKGGE